MIQNQLQQGGVISKEDQKMHLLKEKFDKIKRKDRPYATNVVNNISEK